jgi:hypothetical protein
MQPPRIMTVCVPFVMQEIRFNARNSSIFTASKDQSHMETFVQMP